MTGVKARTAIAGGHWVELVRWGLMYYVILFIGVLSFLALVAWLQPARRPLAAAGHEAPSARPDSLVAQLLKGERREDKPCITPIDCVQAKRCAGYCGCR